MLPNFQLSPTLQVPNNNLEDNKWLNSFRLTEIIITLFNGHNTRESWDQ